MKGQELAGGGAGDADPLLGERGDPGPQPCRIVQVLLIPQSGSTTSTPCLQSNKTFSCSPLLKSSLIRDDPEAAAVALGQTVEYLQPEILHHSNSGNSQK